MKKLIFIAALMMTSRAFAFGMTADQMYRNVLMHENDGVMPSYYTAREQAEQKKKSAERLRKKEKPDSKNPLFLPDEKPFSELDAKREWEAVIKAVQEKRPTPFDLEVIRKRADNDETQAVELLAWMYATGNGIRQDLVQAWSYYMRAAGLGVETGAQNARAVYRGMTAAQRAQLTAF